jgi:hypothetical protein
MACSRWSSSSSTHLRLVRIWARARTGPSGGLGALLAAASGHARILTFPRTHLRRVGRGELWATSSVVCRRHRAEPSPVASQPRRAEVRMIRSGSYTALHERDRTRRTAEGNQRRWLPSTGGCTRGESSHGCDDCTNDSRSGASGIPNLFYSGLSIGARRRRRSVEIQPQGDSG